MDLILKKDKLLEFLSSLPSEVLAPVERDGVITFDLLEDKDEIVLDGNSKKGPKGVIFPQAEAIYSFNLGEDTKINPPDEDSPKVIFGIRPCDASSFLILDSMFGDGYKDTYYLNKREKTTLIGLACKSPKVNCFCTSLGVTPYASEGMDLMFTDLSDRYYVEVLTDKGKALVGDGDGDGIFSEAKNEDKEERDKVHRDAMGAIKRRVDIKGVSEKLDANFESPLWQDIAVKCIRCGTCTYLCPTCHCFDVQDEVLGSKGSRVRIWDSCMYPEYTLHTSGHNPRPVRMNRMRNRIYHKYKYYPDNFDFIACVGCGRCVSFCPVNIDIIDILLRVKDL